MRTLALAAAALAPAAGAAAALVPWRSVRRGLWFAALTAALAGAGFAFWEAYGGEPLVWRTFRGGLFSATLVASLHLGTLVAGVRALSLESRPERLALAGLGVAAAGAAGCALTTSAAGLALFLPLPALAAAGATLAGERLGLSARGLVGLALADLAAAAGIWLLADAADTTLLPGGPDALGSVLLLGAAAVKAGSVPWTGTWSLASGTAAPALVAVGVRAQAVALAAAAGLGGPPPVDPAWLGGAAAVLALACGASALARGRGMAGAAGLGGAALGLSFALGGGVGGRAFVLLAVTLPVLWGAAALLTVRPDEPAPGGSAAETSSGTDGETELPQPPRPAWRMVATAALAAVVPGLVLVPLTGTHPGAWMTVSLAGRRALADPTWLVPAGALLAGTALALAGGLRTLREVAPGRLAAVAGAAVAAGSLYAGAASGPLAGGWLVRVAADLGLAGVLPSAGPPDLPPARALGFALAVLPALLVVAGLVWMVRGTGPAGPGAPLAAPRSHPLLEAARSMRGGGRAWAGVLVAEGLALAVIARVVLSAAGRGFL